MKKFLKVLTLVFSLTGIQQVNAAAAEGTGGADAASEHAFGHSAWKALKPGSVVHLVALASKVTSAERTMAEARLATYGLKAQWNEAAFAEFPEGDPSCPKRAMAPEAAFADLMAALKNPEVDAVWAFRGGRLSLELWELLDKLSPAELSALPQKPIIGFSDITSILLWFTAHGFPVIHGPLALFGEDAKKGVNGETTLAPTVDILMGKTTELTYKGLIPLNDTARAVSTVEGPVVGGNLSSLGYYKANYGKGPLPSTPHIAVVETCEDLGDDTRAESILRSLGDFWNNTQAIIFGQFHGESYTSAEFAALQARFTMLIQRFASKIKTPVFITADPALKSFQFGHGAKNDVLPFGFPAVLTVSPADPMETTLRILGKSKLAA